TGLGNGLLGMVGHLGFTVMPKAGLATGTQIRNVAFITTGNGPTIRTDQVNDADPSQGTDPNKQDLVTIDSGPPSAGVLALPAAEPSSSFAVAWAGQDVAGGSGIAYYDVYYSDNGGAYQPLLRHTTLTSTTFRGAPGHSYGFYSVATDNVGNAQATPAKAQATTLVRLATTTAVTSSAANNTLNYGQGVTLTAAVGASDPAAALSALAGETVVFTDGSAVLGKATLNASGVATFVAAGLGAGTHVITATYAGDTPFQGSTGLLKGGLAVNRVSPVFSRLTASQSIAAGTASVTLSGVLSAPTAAPAGQTVTVSVGGISVTATVKSDGSFSAVLGTVGLASSSVPYTITYFYGGSVNFSPAANTGTTLTVTAHPVDVTPRLAVRVGGAVRVPGSTLRSNYNYMQSVTVSNTSGAAIAGPISLQLVGLVNATLYGGTGTSSTVNRGSPYVLLSNVSLAAGGSLTITLYFYDPTSTPPRYAVHIIAGGRP
ncbi:MAG TPA: Ig-like domain-containing protein, partial [Gemmataceae bacterium]|nr:Ig-like domain-containing protein [Gemmataceae bacterium]